MVLNPEYRLYECRGKPFCSSLQVAETFEKRHDNVLQAIREAVEKTANFAPNFSGANFVESQYKDRGKFYPEYLLTKDGFSYVAMGFTGEKAAVFKVAYIITEAIAQYLKEGLNKDDAEQCGH
jgi:Rha family phage regulatory protein